MDIQIIIQTLINGLFVGGVYALVAIGLTLVYGVMLIINFAHADFLMIGMYLAFWAFTLLGFSPYVTMFFTVIFLFLLGLVLQRVLIRPVLNAPILNQILLTLGLSNFMVGLSQFFWRAEPKSLILPISSSSLKFAGLVFNYPRSIAFILSFSVAIFLFYFLNHTKTGKAIRATSQNRRAAGLMGINVNKIYGLVFGIGVALAGLGGTLLTPNFPMTPTIGATFSFTAFVIVVLGTMGNFLGAFLGAMIIGVAEAFGGLIIGSELKQMVSMAIFIFVLLVKPGGLFGGKNS